MDYRTAAAASQNIAGIANAFMAMNDPANIAKAGLTRGALEEQNLRNAGLGIANKYAPLTAQAGLDLSAARVTTEGAQQGYLKAGADERRTASDINGLRLRAGKSLLEGDSAASAFMVPTTTYSQGGNAGPDEMTDQWTEKGYSSTGQNLTDGMVAVNPSRHPIGTIFQNPETGEVFVAGDKHGNENASVVDIYRAPKDYKAESREMPLRVVGQEKLPYGTTAAQIQEIRDKYARAANVFGQGGANDLAQATARNAMLAAGDDEQAGRNAAAAISGNLPGQGEYSTPAQAEAFQNRGLSADYTKAMGVEGLQQTGENQRTALGIAFGGPGSGTGSRSSAASGLPDPTGVSMVKPLHEMVGNRFGMATDSGPVIAPEMQQAAGAWQATFSNLVDNGVSPIKAEVIADQHHRIGSVQEEDPFFGSPRKETGENFGLTAMTPEEASAFAPAPALAGGTGRPGIAELFAAVGLGGQQPGVTGPDQTTAPAASTPPPPAAAPDPIPQTGADKPPGKRLGDEKAKAKQQQQADEGTNYNKGTLSTVKQAIARGASLDDIMATAFAGGKENDAELAKLLIAPGSSLAMRWGAHSPEDVRNALRDERALTASGIDPARVRSHLNPVTGKSDAAALFEMYRPK